MIERKQLQLSKTTELEMLNDAQQSRIHPINQNVPCLVRDDCQSKFEVNLLSQDTKKI